MVAGLYVEPAGDEAILRPQGLTYYGQISAPYGPAMTNGGIGDRLTRLLRRPR